MNSTTTRRTNPAILSFFDELCFRDDEVLSRVVDPSEEFEGGGDFEGGDGGDGALVGLRSVGVVVGVGACFGPAGVGVGAGPIDEGGDAEGGDADGAIVVLNGLPSFLKVGMFCSFGGIGPENKLFSTFRSLRGRSCKLSRVPDS